MKRWTTHAQAICRLLLVATATATAGAQSQEVTSVTIFRSGVAEFEHRIQLDGDGDGVLSIPREEMSDVLRSLVIRAAEGAAGNVTISYPSGGPIEERLSAFKIDLSDVTTLGDAVRRLRGRRIAAKTNDGEETLGRVVGVSEAAPDGSAEILLQTESGLRRITISETAAITIADTSIVQSIDAALDVLATDSGSGPLHTVSIRIDGGADREIRLRYLRGMPVWKTSYRAVLSEGSVSIEGWAHVDNTSNNDWTDVALRLVSSAPNTAFYDIFPPRRVPRGEPASIVDTYRAEAAESVPSVAARAMPEAEQRNTGVGFELSRTVTIPRGRSVMIPLVDAAFDGEVVRTYDGRTDDEHPELAIAFTNRSDIQLPAGPVTIYEEDRYAGDSYLEIVPVGAERTIPFARDLNLRVTRRRTEPQSELRTVAIVDGLLLAERRERLTTEYRIRLDGDRYDRVPPVRVRHPARSGWDLVSPQPIERRGSLVLLQARNGSLAVIEERIREQRFALTEADRETLLAFSDNRLLEPRVRRVIDTVVELRDQLQRHRSERRRLEEELDQIFRDQERIRGNMAELDRNSSLYRRYVDRLEQQEERLSGLRADLEDARDAERRAEESLSEYVETLD